MAGLEPRYISGGFRVLACRGQRGQARARRLVIGQTDGGRPLTLVVERTREPTTWLIVTGWDATGRERKLLGG